MAASYPIALHLAGRACLIVGTGDEASRRARTLSAAGARVSVIPAETFSESALDGVWLVVQTERDPALAQRISSACDARQKWFCATDCPAHNGFSHMALARAGLVQIAISTDGRAPALARRLREELQQLLDRSGLVAFADKLAELRERTASSERGRVLGAAVQGLRLSGRLELPEK